MQPLRQKMWLASHDDEFRQKRDDNLNVYYNSPADEHIVCVDEKPRMQALERRHPDIAMQAGRYGENSSTPPRHAHLDESFRCAPRQALRLHLRRPEQRHLHRAARPGEHLLPPATLMGAATSSATTCWRTNTDDVVDWFEEHPRWTRHFTPKHGSWLNQVEGAFSIFGRRVLSRGSFVSTDDLRRKSEAYLIWHNQTDQPFRWGYRPKSWAAKSVTTSDGRH